jgi:hypothetical protein
LLRLPKSGLRKGHTSHALGGHVRPPARQTGHQPSGHNIAANQALSDLISGLLTWFSPAYLAGAIIGFGATGTLLAPILHGWLQLGVVLVGAYIICFFCIRPLLTGVRKWASLPAKILSDAILEIGTAVTDFDSKGYGLVRLNLDGQVGENYLRYRQIELLPDIAPAIAQALAQARLVTIACFLFAVRGALHRQNRPPHFP